MSVDRKLNELTMLKQDIAHTLLEGIKNNLDKVLRVQNSVELTDDFIRHAGMGKARQRVVFDLLSGILKEVEKSEEKFVTQLEDLEKAKRGMDLYKRTEVFEAEMFIFNKEEFEELIRGIKLLVDCVKR